MTSLERIRELAQILRDFKSIDQTGPITIRIIGQRIQEELDRIESQETVTVTYPGYEWEDHITTIALSQVEGNLEANLPTIELMEAVENQMPANYQGEESGNYIEVKLSQAQAILLNDIINR